MRYIKTGLSRSCARTEATCVPGTALSETVTAPGIGGIGTALFGVDSRTTVTTIKVDILRDGIPWSVASMVTV